MKYPLKLKKKKNIDKNFYSNFNPFRPLITPCNELNQFHRQKQF